MKLAFLSDIRQSARAEIGADDVDRVQPDTLLCLGEPVGCGAYPNEAIELVRRRTISTAMGNCDEGVGLDLSYRS